MEPCLARLARMELNYANDTTVQLKGIQISIPYNIPIDHSRAFACRWHAFTRHFARAPTCGTASNLESEVSRKVRFAHSVGWTPRGGIRGFSGRVAKLRHVGKVVRARVMFPRLTSTGG